jgi:hypothetical protein
LGCCHWKIRSFHAIQILQLMRIMMSMKKDTLSWFRKDRRTSKGSLGGMFRFNEDQQLRAKVQLINKWSKVSSTLGRQSTQSYEGRTWFFHRRMFLVLSRSLSSNQKKTVCRCFGPATYYGEYPK